MTIHDSKKAYSSHRVRNRRLPRATGTLVHAASCSRHLSIKGVPVMKKTGLAIAVLVAAGLASAPFAAEAKSHKHAKSNSSTTTGSNTKSNNAANPSSEGNVGPGTNNNNGSSK
jgi:hypothetical protein